VWPRGVAVRSDQASQLHPRLARRVPPGGAAPDAPVDPTANKSSTTDGVAGGRAVGGDAGADGGVCCVARPGYRQVQTWTWPSFAFRVSCTVLYCTVLSCTVSYCIVQ